ncbi:longevity-assurance protein [Hypoxylon rubiginosum]|uniref:Longevity-assurance protein n=1 Tax=Hypoxylon rubiginosum TaxID=110542 RepID=A0ACB9ZE21_9PEZI|nr:longevity-assurance protein [Hypoxylon rubiginosum]
MTKGTGNGPLKSSTRWLFENQTGLSFNFLGILLLTHVFTPSAQPFTSKFITLSGYNPTTGKYGVNQGDIGFVTFCIVLFSGIRAGSMKYVLTPLARHWGVTKNKDITRFSEQGWMLMYNTVFWTLGMFIYSNSAYFLNLDELWTNWPKRELDGLTKFYTLAQGAYWTQQLLVVNLEARRQDYWQMIVHHLATMTLIASAYAYHQTRVANLILVLMDAIELLFPLAKCLKCLGFTTVCDVLFGLFLLTWLVTRHLFYLMVCWSIYFDMPRVIPADCYRGAADNIQGLSSIPDGWSYLLEPFRDPAGTVCMGHGIRVGFLSYLLLLQAIMIVWSVLIVRVAVRVLKGDSAEDIRSDDEEEEEVSKSREDEPELSIPQIIEEEVGAESIDFEAWKRRAGSQGAAKSTGISLLGHSDRKEFLDRIGCEKQID